VLVRYQDGSVRAYDRKLSQLLWEWREGAVAEASLTGCLAEKGVFLVPHGSELRKSSPPKLQVVQENAKSVHG
jgi:hypothetical protein